MKIQNLINEGGKELKKNNISSYVLDSEILLSKIMNKDRKYLILNPGKEVENEKLIIFKKFIYQRSLGKPIAYILKKKRILEK